MSMILENLLKVPWQEQKRSGITNDISTVSLYKNTAIVICSPEIHLCINGHLIFDKGTKFIQRGNEQLHIHVDIHTYHHDKINMSWILNLNVKARSIKLLEENIGEYFMTWDYAKVSLTVSGNNHKSVINLKFKTSDDQKMVLRKWLTTYRLPENRHKTYIWQSTGI